MSMTMCQDCGEQFDTDVDEGSFSDTGDYLCEMCSEADDE